MWVNPDDFLHGNTGISALVIDQNFAIGIALNFIYL